MKKIISFRIDENLDKVLTELSKKNGITKSQLIENCCKQFCGKIDLKKTTFETKKSNKKTLHFSLNENLFNSLYEQAKLKNSTLSQEVRFRLNATFNHSSFNQIELKNLSKLNADLNRLGNLFKLSIDNSSYDNSLIFDIENKINSISTELKSILIKSNKRKI